MDYVLDEIEPEQRHLRQNLSLSGYSVRENTVESRNPVGGDDQKSILQIVNIPDLTSGVELKLSDLCFHQCLFHRNLPTLDKL